MAYFQPSRLSAFFSVGAALLLSACCANKICDCPNEQSDVVKLVFDRTKFSATDLDTIVVQRYPRIITRATKPETVTLFRTAAQAYDTLYLNNATPFAQAGSSKLNQYRYYVRYLPTPHRTRSQIVLAIDTVALKGSLDADGCCTCYNNTLKTVTSRQDSTASSTTARVTNLKTIPVLTITK
jgi:hypothetical protein